METITPLLSFYRLVTGSLMSLAIYYKYECMKSCWSNCISRCNWS